MHTAHKRSARPASGPGSRSAGSLPGASSAAPRKNGLNSLPSRLHAAREVSVEDGHAHLQVPSGRVEVEVEGADRAEDAVHTHVLCMHVPLFVEVHLHQVLL